MRISVLSFCIVLSLIFTPAVFAQAENAPGYANERFYPDSVQQIQEDPSWWEQSFCQWFGGFISFGCQGVRTQHVLSPEELKAEVNQADAEAAKPGLDGQSVQGLHTQVAEAILAEVEKEIEEADSVEQVLGVQEVLSSIFGGGEGGTGFINTYIPSDKSFCGNSSSVRERTECLAIALRPASVQEVAQVQNPDIDGDGQPDPDPINPDEPIEPPIGPQPAPTGNDGYDLVAGFKSYCVYGGTPGRVHNTNVNCLTEIVPQLKNGAISEMRNSAIAFDDLQCVGFVRGVNIQFKGQLLDNGGNAIDYATNIPSGYRLIRKGLVTSPKVGDLLLWNTGTYGHIAYISVVYDKDLVGVLEANWGVDGMVGFRQVYIRAYDILGWLTQG